MAAEVVEERQLVLAYWLVKPAVSVNLLSAHHRLKISEEA